VHPWTSQRVKHRSLYASPPMPELDRQRDKSGQPDLRTFRSVFPNREPAIAFWYFPFDPRGQKRTSQTIRWGSAETGQSGGSPCLHRFPVRNRPLCRRKLACSASAPRPRGMPPHLILTRLAAFSATVTHRRSLTVSGRETAVNRIFNWACMLGVRGRRKERGLPGLVPVV